MYVVFNVPECFAYDVVICVGLKSIHMLMLLFVVSFFCVVYVCLSPPPDAPTTPPPSTTHPPHPIPPDPTALLGTHASDHTVTGNRGKVSALAAP